MKIAAAANNFLFRDFSLFENNQLSTSSTKPFNLLALQEEPEYLKQMDVRGVIAGGTTEGKLLETVKNPCLRTVGFREISNPREAGQTWVIIHGWNSNPDGLADLIQVIAHTHSNDRVLVLDWREASVNNNLPAPKNIMSRGNGKAATWIGPTAEFAVKVLQNRYGIDSQSALEGLNLVGHSLGSLVSAEIGRIYKTGRNRLDTFVTTANGEGVKTITILDPPSQVNLRPNPLGTESYDLDGRVKEKQSPEKFANVCKFSRAFIGAKSVAGSPELASTAHETFELNFRSIVDTGREHLRVVKTFANLVNWSGAVGESFRLDAYCKKESNSGDNYSSIRQFRRGRFRAYQGIIHVNTENQPTMLVSKIRKNKAKDNSYQVFFKTKNQAAQQSFSKVLRLTKPFLKRFGYSLQAVRHDRAELA